MAQQFKTGTEQSNFLQKDLAKRMSRNPAYSKMAQYARGDENDVSDEYFYAFKDAYEQSPDFNKYNLMMEDDIGSRLSDRYWKLMDDDYESYGLIPGTSYGDKEYEGYHLPAFEKKYGTHDDFVKRSTDAWKRWMAENYGGHSEDHQSFGRYIADHPDRFTKLNQLQNYYDEWDGRQNNYPELLEFWKNKLGFGGK